MSQATAVRVPAPPMTGRAGRRAGGNAPWWQGLLLAVAMLATLPLVNAHIRSDGNEYYAYVRSLVIDHDLQFDDEYAHGEDTFKSAEDVELILLPNGYRRNFASVGPSLMWTPFFLAGHVAARVLTSLGHPVAVDGYSWPYVWACAIGTALYAFLGLWLSYRMALRFAAPGAALLATIAIWLASSLPVYLYFLPFHAHGVASFTVAWFFWNWFGVRDGGGRWRWLVWGLSLGLVTTTYYLNGVIGVVAILECLLRLGRPREIGRTIVNGLVFTGGFLLAMAPGLIIRFILEGSIFGIGYVGPQFVWADPRLWPVLASPEHGAFLWTPVLLCAVLGLGWLCARSPVVGAIVVCQSVLFYYCVAAYRNWHGHSSFGSRFLTALTPVFVMGLAALIDRFVARRGGARRWAAAWAAVVVLVVWNVGFMFQWGVNLVPNRGPVDMRVMAQNQVTVVPRQIGRFLARYFTARAAVVHEVEQGDLVERPLYKVKR
jgi:hypothetical protein